MVGLVGYGSSDEDDGLGEDDMEVDTEEINHPAATHHIKGNTEQNNTNSISTNEVSKPGALPQPDAPLVGPAMGPQAAHNDLEVQDEESSATSQSPYSTNRALLRNLTLPSLPNYDIPPSPPGSPAKSTSAKFKHFLDLKKQGVHFNQKLAKSAALKNPSLMQKLLDFSGVDEAGQYATTLNKDLWDPNGFPEDAYKEELLRSQQNITRRREEERGKGQRETVEFVPAVTTAESLGHGGTHAVNGRAGQKSAAERVMDGLDRGRSNSPHVQGTKRKTRFD